jgi:glutathione S-transferase
LAETDGQPAEPPNNKEAEDITGKVFGVFSTWIKNQDKSKDKELEDALTAELQKINDYMGTHSWSFLCSDQWSLADCALVPRLYAIDTVARHYKGYTKIDQLPNLRQYMDMTFATDEFKATDYPQEYIIQGWAKYFN